MKDEEENDDRHSATVQAMTASGKVQKNKLREHALRELKL